ncbi:hypothetical protein CRE_17820 [Caenorhabditis remanei]|uniref:Uncharacterized protein n=1 Tax=Caenorhabditis remanei TaxID=31234 RepID=E3MDI5_CAERE|nr:hypothetical protein CRE_17820 [Caenorhabditis remanei]
MSSNRPLSYLIWESVLQNIDANKRFFLFQQCPALRQTENSLPLKVDTLLLDGSVFSVNDAVYKIGIVRKYHNGSETPHGVKKLNEEGGSAVECDVYGFSEHLRNDGIFLGFVKEKAEELREVRKGKAILLGLPDTPEKSRKLEMLTKFINETEEVIYRASLRQNKLPPPFNHYLQVKISTKYGSQEGERVEYIRTISDASDSLFKAVFQKRSNIWIKKLEIESSELLERNLAALNSNLKVRIRNMTIKWGVFMENIQNVLDYENHPLETIEISRDIFVRQENILYHPIVNSAQKLIITVSEWDLAELINKRVHVRKTSDLKNKIIALVNNWLENGRPIGSCFSFEIHNKLDAKNTIKEIEEAQRNKIQLYVNETPKQFRNCLVLWMTIDSNLYIYLEKREKSKMNWDLKLNVLPTENQIPPNA